MTRARTALLAPLLLALATPAAAAPPGQGALVTDSGGYTTRLSRLELWDVEGKHSTRHLSGRRGPARVSVWIELVERIERGEGGSLRILLRDGQRLELTAPRPLELCGLASDLQGELRLALADVVTLQLFEGPPPELPLQPGPPPAPGPERVRLDAAQVELLAHVRAARGVVARTPGQEGGDGRQRARTALRQVDEELAAIERGLEQIVERVFAAAGAAPAAAPAGVEAAGPTAAAQGGPFPAGLIVEEVRPGHGPALERGQVAVVHVRRSGFGDPYETAPGRADRIRSGTGEHNRGLEDGVLGMRVGGVRQLGVPAQLLPFPAPPDWQGPVFVYEVELLAIEPPLETPPELVLPRGLLLEDLQVGEGPPLRHGQVALIRHTRSRVDGTSPHADRGGTRFCVGEGKLGAPGLEVGVLGMRRGGLRRLRMPGRLVFPFRPDEAEREYVIEVELVAIQPGPEEEAR